MDRKLYYKQWVAANREKIREYNKNYMATHRKKMKVALELIEEKGLAREFEKKMNTTK